MARPIEHLRRPISIFPMNRMDALFIVGQKQRRTEKDPNFQKTGNVQ